MAKIKTHKASSKRFRVTRNGKVMKKMAGQDHFNARESGKVTRAKRTPKELFPAYKRAIADLMPN
jgi:large subunit ribosomal protein L35